MRLIFVVLFALGCHGLAIKNVREYRRGNHKWTIPRLWQHRAHKTNKNKTQTQHNMCLTPLYGDNHKERKQDMSPPTNNWC